MASNSIEARCAARVLLIDDDGRVLLFRGRDPARPDAGTWWFTPGGGVESGESLLEAARRELWEETGLLVEDLQGPIHTQDIEFSFEGVTYHQHEDFFYVQVPQFAIRVDGWTPQERALMVESRWWSIDEIQHSKETIYPKEIAALIGDIER